MESALKKLQCLGRWFTQESIGLMLNPQNPCSEKQNLNSNGGIACDPGAGEVEPGISKSF